MIPVVVVEAPTPPPPEAQMEIAMEVCTSGLPRGRCLWRGQVLREGERPAAVAVIHLRGSRGASLEVGASFDQREGWTAQSLVFEPADPPEERWKTIGLLIASLASSAEGFSPDQESDVESDLPEEPPPGEPEGPVELETASRESTSVSEEASETEVEPQGSAQPKEPDESVSVDDDVSFWRSSAYVAAHGGIGFVGEGERSSGVRVGPLARLQIEAIPWHVQAEAGIGWAMMPRNGLGLTSNFLSYDLGLVGRWPFGDFHVGPMAHALVERTQVAVAATDAGQSDRRARWIVGAGLGAAASYALSSGWAIRTEGEWLSMNGGTGILVDGVRVGRIGAQNVRLAFGVAYGFGD